jgi:hypothetical protein
MARTIWKYVLPVADVARLYMPKGARPLAVAEQAGALCLWVEVDPASPQEPRDFLVRGTGNPFYGDEGNHIGTAVIGQFVWHVYEPARKAAER